MFEKTSVAYLTNMTVKNNHTLKIGNNPFGCGCEMMDLFSFINLHGNDTNALDISDINMNCTENDKTPIFQTEIKTFCQNKELSKWVEASGLLLFLAFTICNIILTLCLCYKKTLLIWIYNLKWTRCLLSEDVVDTDKPFDAFISYAHQDTDYVMKVLVEEKS